MSLTLSHPAVLEADDRSALYFSFEGADELMFLCADAAMLLLLLCNVKFLSTKLNLVLRERDKYQILRFEVCTFNICVL